MGRQLEVSRAELYTSLRNRYLEIHGQLPEELWSNAGYRPAGGSDGWRAIERYWYNAFDEWFVTTKVVRHDNGALWSTFYEPALQSSLKHEAMRRVLCGMLDGGSTFGGHRDEFEQVISKLYQRRGSHCIELRDFAVDQEKADETASGDRLMVAVRHPSRLRA